MKITLITVGKLKERYLKDGVMEYSKRLSRYCRLDLIEVADEKTPDGASETIETQIKNKEGERILKYIRDDMYVIALAIDGKVYDSVAFANHMEQLGVMGRGHVAFLIGGSLGLSNAVLSCADEKISFSKMTFPHQLMRVILLEQVYRGFRISKGEPYHK